MTEIISPIPSRLRNVVVGGHVAGADQIIDDAWNMTQEEINNIVMADTIKPTFTASPTAVFVGVESGISLSASVNTNASITIKKSNDTLKTGTGTSLSYTDTITPDAAGDIAYSGVFVVGAVTKTASKNVAAVYPIRIGSGASFVDGTPLNTPKTSPAGEYTVTVAANGSYVYFNVPATMTIHGASMGTLDFPLEEPTNVTIDGVSYKSYRSSNTYDAGSMTILIS